MVGQGSADEPEAKARPGTSEGRDLRAFGEKGWRDWPRGSLDGVGQEREADKRPGSGVGRRSRREERRDSVSDIVSVGSPEGVWWDMGMGEGWGHQI